MPWTIRLEEEDKTLVEELESPFYSEILKDGSFYEKLKLLRYVDPWGNTVFNSMQMGDLIKDLRLLNSFEENKLIKDIIGFAQKCKDDVHTYMVFVGD